MFFKLINMTIGEQFGKVWTYYIKLYKWLINSNAYIKESENI